MPIAPPYIVSSLLLFLEKHYIPHSAVLSLTNLENFPSKGSVQLVCYEMRHECETDGGSVLVWGLSESRYFHVMRSWGDWGWALQQKFEYFLNLEDWCLQDISHKQHLHSRFCSVSCSDCWLCVHACDHNTCFMCIWTHSRKAIQKWTVSEAIVADCKVVKTIQRHFFRLSNAKQLSRQGLHSCNHHTYLCT